MKVSDDKISVGDVNIHTKRSEEQAGQAAHGEQADEAECVQQRRGECNRTFVQSGRPVEDFDGGGNRNQVTEERKNQSGIDGHAGNKHVMCPHQKSKDGNPNTRHRHKAVAEDSLARKARHNFADDAHRGQNHDVNRGMGIEPKQVLEQ